MRRFTLADLLVLITVMMWGLNVTVVKILVGTWQPMALAFARISLAFVLYLAVVPVWEGAPRISRRAIPLLFLTTACGLWLNQVVFTYGMQRTTASSMTLILTTVPIFTSLGSFVLGWERPGWRHWVGIVAGVIGVILIVFAQPSDSQHSATIVGDALGLVAAAGWAGYSLSVRPLMLSYSPYRISLFVMLIGVITIAPIGIPQIAASRLGSISPLGVGLLLYAGLGAIGLTNILWFTGIQRLGPARATVYVYLEPFFGLIAAVLFLHETLSPLQLVGGMTVLAGIIYGRERRPEAPSLD